MEAALIGYGYWGMNLARTICETGHHLKVIYDEDPKRIEKAKELYDFRKADTLSDALNSVLLLSIIHLCIRNRFSISRN
ncbi:NAD(P)-binding domain-containing protein [bacterium]|nr:NAD(P)-binding domain-containing protein [bacterium]